MMYKSITLVGFILAGIVLSGCENTREQFDFSKRAPDEFAVVTRAPLELPPEYTLRPPQPGAPRPQEMTTSQQARAAVVGIESTKQIAREQNVSTGEAILLQKTGAAQANPAIRRVVDEETAKIAEDEMPGIDQLRKMVGKPVEAPAKVVDPVQETERIRANKAQGKPITTGKTPVKED